MRRLKINNDTMTTIVVLSILFCVAVVITGFIFAWYGREVSSIVSSALAVFGTELGICGLMTIFNRWTDHRDRRHKREDD